MDHYIQIGLLAERVNELEALRIADENRIRSIEQSGDARTAMLDGLYSVNDSIKGLEKSVIKDLENALKEIPGVGEWVAETPGLGAKTVGRLIGSIGNPAMNYAAGRPRRGPAELWAYMGLHVTEAGEAPRRKKGTQANWNTESKTRSFLVAEGCIKAVGGERKGGAVMRRSPYRDVYDKARAKNETAVHKHDCFRCGPKGKPALAGSELSDGHRHARATRETMKAIVKDLFVICKREHELAELRFYAIDDREALTA